MGKGRMAGAAAKEGGSSSRKGRKDADARRVPQEHWLSGLEMRFTTIRVPRAK